MATNELILRKFQSGTEATRGTLVPATRIIYADITPSYDRPIQEFPDRSGTFFQRRRVAYGRPTIGFTGTDLVTFEDLALWMQMGIKGGVVGVTDGGTPPAYTYNFLPSPATDDIKSWTLEFNEPGNVYIATQVMMNTWTLRVAPDDNGGWMLDFEMIARDWTTGAYTGALSDRTTEVVRAPGTKAYIDTTTVGTTQVLGKVIDYSLAANQNVHMKAFMEDDGAWAANKVGRGARTYDLTMQMEFDTDAEFANYRNTNAVERKIRIEREGSQIHGTSVTNKRVRVDTYGYWRSIGFGDRDGNLTATMGLQGFYDSGASADARVEVVNALVTLP